MHTMLLTYPTTTPLSIAVSGGLDSMSLLHAIASCALPNPLRVLHVNHGLNPHAQHWANFVTQEAHKYGIPCQICTITDTPSKGDSIEAWARRVRYAAFASMLTPGEIVLTAHTADDQAETLLLQLLRGAGLPGLAAMPAQRTLGSGYLHRPWLTVTRETLINYAKMHALTWIEDDSNDDARFDRNYLRHTLMPLLKTRWPNYHNTFARSARWCAEAQQQLDVQFASQTTHQTSLGTWGEARFELTTLLTLPESNQRAQLRHWFHTLQAPQPTEHQWLNIERTLLKAGANTMPMMQWGGWQLRRYRHTLYCAPHAVWQQFTPGPQTIWHLDTPLTWGPYHFTGTALTPKAALVIRSARATDRFLLPGQTHHRTWKYWCQHQGVPPWERACVPLLCTLHNEIIALLPHTPLSGWETYFYALNLRDNSHVHPTAP